MTGCFDRPITQQANSPPRGRFGTGAQHRLVGGLLDTLEHPNQKQYPGRRIFIVDVEGYACVVPFVEDDEVIFMKTRLI